MHEAIRHLAAELYQKDLHFVMELVQNADDNSYLQGVSPEIGFVLVEEDIAQVGVKWTLLVLNNEVGFTRENVESLCSIGRSTKKGRRASGYIGEKGIGFKSVFLITQHPIVISRGFRMHFNEVPTDETDMGFIVPEWTEKPSDADLLRCLAMPQLPTTVIVLPVRDDKVQAIREQLHELSPSLLLFLNKLEKLYTRERTAQELARGWEPFSKRNAGMCVQRYHPTPLFGVSKMASEHPNYSLVCLSHETEADYHIWRQSFPVKPNHAIPERKEVEAWIMTLAFPRSEAGKVSAGDLYAFLPTKIKTGFPFVINADFLLVSSRESMRADSVWNKGILSCISDAFMAAFHHLLRSVNNEESACWLVYEFIPLKRVVARDFGGICENIHRRLKMEDIVLCDSGLGQTFPKTIGPDNGSCFFCRPSLARMVSANFRHLLAEAWQENVPAPALLQSQSLYIVHNGLQAKQGSLLVALGVQHFTEKDYVNCLNSPGWILNLPEHLYAQVLAFLCTSKLISNRALDDIPCLKYVSNHRDASNTTMTVSLTSPSISRTRKHLYLAQAPDCQNFLSEWLPVFDSWVTVHFIPPQTKQQIDMLSATPSGAPLTSWLQQTAGVVELSVQSYAQLLVTTAKEQDLTDPSLAVTILHFLLKAKTDGHLNVASCKQIFSEAPLVHVESNQDHIARGVKQNSSILLPASVCQWPKLIIDGCPWRKHVLVLSESYLRLPDVMKQFTTQDVVDFLRTVSGGGDVTDLKDVPDAPLMLLQSQSNLTADSVHLLLRILPKMASIPCKLLESLKRNDWVKTVHHGYKQPWMTILKQQREWESVLDAKDAPFVDWNFYGDLRPYVAMLEKVGMVCDVMKGGDAVGYHVKELMRANRLDVESSSAVTWYKYLHRCNWQPADLSEFQIWDPCVGQWIRRETCVVSDWTGLFLGDGSLLHVLDRMYQQKNVLQFFEINLQVPNDPSPVNICQQLWNDWRKSWRAMLVSNLLSCLVLILFFVPFKFSKGHSL